MSCITHYHPLHNHNRQRFMSDDKPKLSRTTTAWAHLPRIGRLHCIRYHVTGPGAGASSAPLRWRRRNTLATVLIAAGRAGRPSSLRKRPSVAQATSKLGPVIDSSWPAPNEKRQQSSDLLSENNAIDARCGAVHTTRPSVKAFRQCKVQLGLLDNKCSIAPST